MKEVRLGFVDTFDGAPQFFLSVLNREFAIYRFVRDDANPHILIFGDRNFGDANMQRKYAPDKCIRIFYTGENVRPDDYIAHYYLSFDHIFDDQHFRLPLWVLNMHYMAERFGHSPTQHSYRMMAPANPFDRDFCGYVQSNPNCEKRNSFFRSLSDDYRQISSAGPHMNNAGFVLPRGETGVIEKINWLSRFKFTLAFENGAYPGYATEKLLEAYLAGTVPIYWGSPTIGLDFNESAFLNWYDFNNDKEFIDYIRFVDTHKDVYEKIFSENLFKSSSLSEYRKHIVTLCDWFERMLEDIQ